MYHQEVISRKTLLASWRSKTKIAGSGSGSGSISQRHGSADPDPYQIVKDPNTAYKDASLLTYNSLQFLQFTQIYNLNFKGVHWQNSFAFNIWKKAYCNSIMWKQCCGSGSGIPDWVPFWPLDPGSEMGESQHPDPGSGMNNPDNIF